MRGWEGEPGFWSITRAEDIDAVSRDWETFSSEVKGFVITDFGLPVEMQNQMMLGQDPPRHDRLRALFQRGFTPNRIAEHEVMIRRIAAGVLDGIGDRQVVDLVYEVGAPIVGRVIGTF
jgi:cholest-4-en-3-one 26-monooxygenase